MLSNNHYSKKKKNFFHVQPNHPFITLETSIITVIKSVMFQYVMRTCRITEITETKACFWLFIGIFLILPTFAGEKKIKMNISPHIIFYNSTGFGVLPIIHL